MKISPVCKYVTLLAWFALVLSFAVVARCQSTATLTGTVTDTDAQTWNNATWTATINNPGGGPLIDQFTQAHVPNQVTGTLSATGVVSGTIERNDALLAVGTSYTFQICPQAGNASGQPLCQTLPQQAITASTYNLGNYASFHTTPPRIIPIAGSFAYNTTEANTAPIPIGATFWNVSTNCQNVYNVSVPAWQCSAGTSVVWPPTTDIVISNGTNSPAGLAPVNNDCVEGVGSAWTAQPCAPVLAANTNVLFTGSSLNGDDTHALSSAIAAGAWSCNGTTCTINTTAAHGLVAGQWVTTDFLTGWFANPANQDYWSTGVSVFQVNAAGLGSNVFTVNYTLNTGSGSGGSVYSAAQWIPQLTMTEPFFSGRNLIVVAPHGSTLAFASANYTALYHSFSPAVTGNPGLFVITDDKNDFQACLSLSTIQGYYTSLFTSAHTDGWSVAVSTTPPSNWNFGSCPAGGQVFTELQRWLREQTKTAANAAGGQYWDKFVDLASVVPDPTNTNLVASNGGIGPSGSPLVAKEFNRMISTQDSVVARGLEKYLGFFSNSGALHYAFPFNSFEALAFVNDSAGNYDNMFQVDTNRDKVWFGGQNGIEISPWFQTGNPPLRVDGPVGGNQLSAYFTTTGTLTGAQCTISDWFGLTASNLGEVAWCNNNGNPLFGFNITGPGTNGLFLRASDGALVAGLYPGLPTGTNKYALQIDVNGVISTIATGTNVGLTSGTNGFYEIVNGTIHEYVNTGTLNNNTTTTVTLPFSIPATFAGCTCSDNGGRVQTGNTQNVGCNVAGQTAPFATIQVLTPSTTVSAYCVVTGK